MLPSILKGALKKNKMKFKKNPNFSTGNQSEHCYHLSILSLNLFLFFLKKTLKVPECKLNLSQKEFLKNIQKTHK